MPAFHPGSRRYFYPRSPCGERPYGRINDISRLIFLSTLSLRRATKDTIARQQIADISIHALLAESDFTTVLHWYHINNFYPRSPCGERHSSVNTADQEARFLSTLSLRRATVTVLGIQHRVGISIHALLAESDSVTTGKIPVSKVFLSTLSLRRATL